MEIHGFTEGGSIDATIAGERLSVPDDPANRHRQMIAEWEADGNTIPPYVAPEPEPYIPNNPTLIASGVFTVDNGIIKGLEAAAGIAFAFPMGPGLYWLFFSDEQPDKAFSVYPASSSGQINATARELDHIELCVTDGGQPVDPS